MAAYIIGHVNITNQERYNDYTKDVPTSLEPFGGKFLVRGGKYETKEGEWQPQRVVLIEFPSFDSAQAWYNSEFYQKIIKIRWEASNANIMLVDGYNP
jgi:uncharacterized protein (DUF1330 family)